MRIRAMTLDAAGTLFELAEPVGDTYARVAARHGIAAGAEQLARGFREAFAAAPPLAFPGASPTRLAEHERAWWYAVVRRTFGSAARAPGFEACFAELYDWYAHPEAWRACGDAPAALQALRAAGVALAVVSNFDGRLPAILSGLGLLGQLDSVVYSARAGAAKPDPAIFHEALRRVGRHAGEALHVGDSLRLDVEGARAAGLEAILLDRGATSGEAPPRVRTVDTLAEVPALLTLF